MKWQKNLFMKFGMGKVQSSGAWFWHYMDGDEHEIEYCHMEKNGAVLCVLKASPRWLVFVKRKQSYC